MRARCWAREEDDMPHHDRLLAVAPEIILTFTAGLLLLVEAFLPRYAAVAVADHGARRRRALRGPG